MTDFGLGDKALNDDVLASALAWHGLIERMPPYIKYGTTNRERPEEVCKDISYTYLPENKRTNRQRQIDRH